MGSVSAESNWSSDDPLRREPDTAEQAVIKHGGWAGAFSGTLILVLMILLGLAPVGYLLFVPALLLVIAVGFTTGMMVGTVVPWIFLKVRRGKDGPQQKTIHLVLSVVVGVLLMLFGVTLKLPLAPLLCGAVLAGFTVWLFLKKAVLDVENT